MCHRVADSYFSFIVSVYLSGFNLLHIVDATNMSQRVTWSQTLKPKPLDVQQLNHLTY